MSQKDLYEKDYYKILGVSKEATSAEIKKAFRKIARENHPDQHPGDKKAEQRFKEASEANDILSDPQKRKQYDEARSLLGGGYRFQRPGSAGGTTGSPSMDDILKNMSGAGGLGDVFSSFFNVGNAGQTRTAAPKKASRRGSDVEGEVTIDFMESIDGATVSVQMISDDPCSVCRGTGAKAGTVPKVCPTCQGSGVQSNGIFSTGEPCKTCNGRGLVVEEPCPACAGSGRAKSNKTMQVRIPSGVSDSQRIRIKGKGGKGENGGAAGDLYVTVHVKPHAIFGRKAYDLTIEVPVTFAEATLGAEIEVPTLKGSPVRLKVPAGLQSGAVLRVKGKGVQKPNAEYGNLLVSIKVVVPEHVTPEAEESLKAFTQAVNQPNPRENLLETSPKRAQG